MLKKIALTLVLSVISVIVIGQFYKRSHLDSLKNAVKKQRAEERINTLVNLSSGYLFVNMDTVMAYVDTIKRESKELEYDWGTCKAYLIESEVHYKMYQKTLPEIEYVRGLCADWFEKNGYEADALECSIQKGLITVLTRGRSAAFKDLTELLPRARKLNDYWIQAMLWHQISTSRDPVFTHEQTIQSSDSAIYYLALTTDSAKIVSQNYKNKFNKSGGIIPVDERIELLNLADRWGNPDFKLTAYEYATYYHVLKKDVDSTLYFIDQINKLSEEMGVIYPAIQINSDLALLYHLTNDWDKAIEYYELVSIKEEKWGGKLREQLVLRKISMLYMGQKKYDLALEYSIKCMKLSEYLDDYYTSNSIKRNLAELYVITEQDEKAEELFKEVIEWALSVEPNRAILILRSNAYIRYGNFLQGKERYEEALTNYNLACKDLETLAYRLPVPKTYILSLYLDMDDIPKADSVHQEMIEVLGESLIFRADFYFLEKGRLMLKKDRPKDAVTAFKGFFEQHGHDGVNEYHEKVYKLISQAYTETGEYKNALESYTRYREIGDSLLASERIENTAKMQSDYEISLKEAEIRDLQQQKELDNLHLQQQESQLELRQLYILLLIIAVLLISVTGYWFFRRFRDKKEKAEIQLKAERAELELESIQSRQKAELAEVKNTIFANVSHEFRTPLTLIKVPAQNYLDEVPEQGKPVLQGILKNTDHLLEMIDDLLDLSKMETGSIELQTSVFDFSNFLTQIKANFASLFQSKNIQFDWSNDLSKAKFKGDENRLKIVLNNLLKNAFNHTPENGKVSCEIVSGEEDEVKFSVSNSGSTIAPKDLPHIFDRYYRANESNYSGTGIGLALSKQIVEMHGGTISAGNVEAEGVVFSVTLPKGLVLGTLDIEELKNDSVEGTEEKVLVNGTEKTSSADQPEILIVEDNEEMRGVLNEVLKHDFQLYFAEDGEEGERMAWEKQPDLIVSDVMMPKKDGFELLHSLKTTFETSHIPVVMLTARADVESKIIGLNQDADDYIGKPFDTPELLARINNLLRQRKHLHKLFSENPLLYSKEIECTSLDAEFLDKARGILEKNFSDGDFSINEFCSALNLNRNSVHVKIKALTSRSTGEYIKNFRLEKAVQLLLHSNLSISEIYADVGFNSPQAFNKVFKKKFDCTPSEYRKKNS